jgi:hypothetical protein
MKRPSHILFKLDFEEYTKEEKNWYCQIKLASSRGDEYKKWFDIYAKLNGGMTYDERIQWRKDNSTPTKDKGVDYSAERQYRGF